MTKQKKQETMLILQRKIKDIRRADFLTEELFNIEQENLKKQIADKMIRRNKNIIPYIKFYRG